MQRVELLFKGVACGLRVMMLMCLPVGHVVWVMLVDALVAVRVVILVMIVMLSMLVAAGEIDNVDGLVVDEDVDVDD